MPCVAAGCTHSMDFHQGVKRERWGSPRSMATMSCAASCGLATALRLPWVAAYHGAWFFYVYCAALVAFAWPIALFEVSLGQRRQRAAKEALSKVNTHARGVGLATGWLALLGTWCYSLVLVYACVYSYEALYAPLPWTVDASASPNLLHEPPALDLQREHFRTVISEESHGGFSFQVFFCVIGLWTILYLLSFDGVTVSASMAGWALIISLLAHAWLLIHTAVNLDGWADGVAQLFIPDSRNAFTIDLVVDGITQALFAVNIGNGALIAFGSFNDEACDTVKQSKIVLLGLIIASLVVCVTSFGVYGTVMAQTTPTQPGVTTIPELLRHYSTSADNNTATGFLGAFYIYTYSSSTLSGAEGCWMALSLFVSAIMLGLVSLHAWSLSLFGTLRDVLENQRLPFVTGVVCAIGCVGSIPFAWGGIGHDMLDAMDRLFVRVALPLAAFLEVVVASYTTRPDAKSEARDIADQALTGRQRVPFTWYYQIRAMAWLLGPLAVLGFGVCMTGDITVHSIVAIAVVVVYPLIVGVFALVPQKQAPPERDMSACWSDKYITQEKPRDVEVVLPNN